MAKRGRPGIGIQRVLDVLIAAMDVRKRVNDPLQRIQGTIGCGQITARKYLDQLEQSGHVRIIKERRSISYLYIDKEESSPEPGIQPPTPTNNSNKKPPKTPTLSKIPDIVVLVDYDNLAYLARDENISLSLKKFKEYLRRFGRIIFADAFISPATTTEDIIRHLSYTGFDVIACPMGYKDKDAVDTSMKTRALTYLLATSIEKIILVSRDADFKDLPPKAADLGKIVEILNPKLIIHQLQGEDEEVKLAFSKRVDKFQTIVAQWGKPADSVHAQRVVLFVKDIVSLIYRLEEADELPHGFRHIQDYVWRNLDPHWTRKFSPEDVFGVMRALQEINLLVKTITNTKTFYRLDREAAIIKDMLTPQKAALSTA